MYKKRIASTVEFRTVKEREEAHAKANERGMSFSTYVRQHLIQLPLLRDGK